MAKAKPKINGTEFKIEKGVPHRRGGRTASAKYPFSQMAVGDSFFVPAKDLSETMKMQWRAKSCAENFSRVNPGQKFSTGRVEGGVRVWRTA